MWANVARAHASVHTVAAGLCVAARRVRSVSRRAGLRFLHNTCVSVQQQLAPAPEPSHIFTLAAVVAQLGVFLAGTPLSFSSLIAATTQQINHAALRLSVAARATAPASRGRIRLLLALRNRHQWVRKAQ